METPAQKTCVRCRHTKPLEQFHKASHLKDGRRAACKDCCRLAEKKRRIKEGRPATPRPVVVGSLPFNLRPDKLYRGRPGSILGLVAIRPYANEDMPCN